MDIRKSASKVFKAIMNKFAEIKRQNKEINEHNKTKGYYTFTHPMSVDVSWDEKVPSKWNPKTQQYEFGTKTYEIWVEGKKVLDGIEGKNDLAYIFNEVRSMLDEQKDKKGWGTLSHTSETIRPSSSGSNWIIPRLAVLTRVELPDAPCKEYKSLENYLNKYGLQRKYGCWSLSELELTPFKLYSVHAGGKRGHLYGEEGERRYLSNKPKKCTEILAELRKHRTAKDTMVCEFGREEYIDPMDKRHSEYYEVECDGEIREYLHIEIKSDKGKVKYQTDIY